MGWLTVGVQPPCGWRSEAKLDLKCFKSENCLTKNLDSKVGWNDLLCGPPLTTTLPTNRPPLSQKERTKSSSHAPSSSDYITFLNPGGALCVCAQRTSPTLTSRHRLRGVMRPERLLSQLLTGPNLASQPSSGRLTP